MSEYKVHSGDCKSLELCPCDAVKCWVEVYDRKPQYEGAVRLRSGYISDVSVEAEDLLKQLEELLPLSEWKEVLCCSPGDFKSFLLIVSESDLENAHPRMRVEDRLDRPGYHNLIFHNEAKALGKQQLVIVRRRADPWNERRPEGPGRDY